MLYLCWARRQLCWPCYSSLCPCRSILFCYICVSHLLHNERLKLGGSRKCQPLMGVKLSYAPLSSARNITLNWFVICKTTVLINVSLKSAISFYWNVAMSEDFKSELILRLLFIFWTANQIKWYILLNNSQKKGYIFPHKSRCDVQPCPPLWKGNLGSCFKGVEITTCQPIVSENLWAHQATGSSFFRKQFGGHLLLLIHSLWVSLLIQEDFQSILFQIHTVSDSPEEKLME